jgi:hypothetical protein
LEAAGIRPGRSQAACLVRRAKTRTAGPLSMPRRAALVQGPQREPPACQRLGAIQPLHLSAALAMLLALESDVSAGIFMDAVTDEAVDSLFLVKAACGRRERPLGRPPARGRSPLAVNLAVNDRAHHLLSRLIGVV